MKKNAMQEELKVGGYSTIDEKRRIILELCSEIDKEILDLQENLSYMSHTACYDKIFEIRKLQKERYIASLCPTQEECSKHPKITIVEYYKPNDFEIWLDTFEKNLDKKYCVTVEEINKRIEEAEKERKIKKADIKEKLENLLIATIVYGSATIIVLIFAYIFYRIF